MSDSKRIAKNTLFLYIRMFVVILVKLYTSRVVLQILGVDDYGIYNLVAGIIVMFTFLNAAMRDSSFRYFMVSLGKNDRAELSVYFNGAVNAHILIGLIIVILGETVGLYIIYNQLNIPPDRFNAALFTYQLAIFSSFFNVLRAPYNAVILAHERMSFYAYLSILEVALNLAVVFILPYIFFDKLELYSILVTAVVVIITLIYMLYCHRNFSETHYRFHFKWRIIFELATFSLWNTLSSFATFLNKQSLNILINIFYGVALNAATAIMTQVSTAVYAFVQNFQTAVSPQLTKDYVRQDWQPFQDLLNTSSKFSYYLMLLISMPFILCINQILSIWLTEVPEYTAPFCVLTLIALLVDTLNIAIRTSIQASGKIKGFQLFLSGITLLAVPAYYLFLKLDWPVELCIGFQILVCAVSLIYGIGFILRNTPFSLRAYMTDVIVPVVMVTVISAIIPVIVSIQTLPYLSNIIYTIVITATSIISILATVALLGLTAKERKFAVDILRKKFHR